MKLVSVSWFPTRNSVCFYRSHFPLVDISEDFPGFGDAMRRLTVLFIHSANRSFVLGHPFRFKQLFFSFFSSR